MRIILSVIIFSLPLFVSAQDSRVVFDLNGTWDFEQTENSDKPSTFTRTIRVPGLIHLASPKIEEYDKFFKSNSSKIIHPVTIGTAKSFLYQRSIKIRKRVSPF